MTLQDLENNGGSENNGVSARGVVVRASRDSDVGAMLAIYLHHIRHGVDPSQHHDIEPPDVDDIKRRRKNMQKNKLPHIVADLAGLVVGYAYAVIGRASCRERV